MSRDLPPPPEDRHSYPGPKPTDDPPAKPAGTPASPFAGRGMFTAHDPASAGRLKGLVDWIALKADGGDQADPSWTEQLRLAGFRVFVWEAEARRGVLAVDEYHADGYIGQAESQAQLDACLDVSLHPYTPKALVTTVTFLPAEPGALPAGWDVLAEAYTNVNPPARPEVMEWEAWRRRTGTPFIAPVFGLYDGVAEGGGRMPLADYLALWPTGSWSGYLAETLTDDDVQALRDAKR